MQSVLQLWQCILYCLVCDCCRPWEILTKEFGQKWGSLSHERRQKIQCEVKMPQEFHTICKDQLNFHPVEIIRKCVLKQLTRERERERLGSS